MAEETLTEKVVDRTATLVRADGPLGSFIAAVNTSPHSCNRNEDIAIAAQEVGYEVGDTFKYRIVIEPKS